MALGVYLYRHMGASAKEIEKPYKAHLTKADLTEIVISLPFRLFLSDK